MGWRGSHARFSSRPSDSREPKGDPPGDLAGRYAEGLSAGLDPGSGEHWPPIIRRSHSIVEAAAIAVSLFESRPWIWDRLSAETRERAAGWLVRVRGRWCYRNNWRLFPLVVHGFLRSVGAPHRQEEIDGSLEWLERLHRGSGWYSDGPGHRYDHYCAWALHLYPAMWLRMGGDHARARCGEADSGTAWPLSRRLLPPLRGRRGPAVPRSLAHVPLRSRRAVLGRGTHGHGHPPCRRDATRREWGAASLRRGGGARPRISSPAAGMGPSPTWSSPTPDPPPPTGRRRRSSVCSYRPTTRRGPRARGRCRSSAAISLTRCGRPAFWCGAPPPMASCGSGAIEASRAPCSATASGGSGAGRWSMPTTRSSPTRRAPAPDTMIGGMPEGPDGTLSLVRRRLGGPPSPAAGAGGGRSVRRRRCRRLEGRLTSSPRRARPDRDRRNRIGEGASCASIASSRRPHAQCGIRAHRSQTPTPPESDSGSEWTRVRRADGLTSLCVGLLGLEPAGGAPRRARERLRSSLRRTPPDRTASGGRANLRVAGPAHRRARGPRRRGRSRCPRFGSMGGPCGSRAATASGCSSSWAALRGWTES